MGQTAFSAAFQDKYFSTITGVASNFSINYPGLVYSKVILSGAYNAAVVRESDQVMLLAYFGGIEKAVYQLKGVRRSICAGVLLMPANMLAEHMEV